MSRLTHLSLTLTLLSVWGTASVAFGQPPTPENVPPTEEATPPLPEPEPVPEGTTPAPQPPATPQPPAVPPVAPPNPDIAPVDPATVAKIAAYSPLLLKAINAKLADDPSLSNCIVKTLSFDTSKQNVRFDAIVGFDFQTTKIVDMLNANLKLDPAFQAYVAVPGDIATQYPPTDELVSEVQNRLLSSTDFPGVWVSDANYVPGENGASLMLQGRLASTDQQASVIDLVNGIIRERRGPEWPLSRVDNMSIIPPSARKASELFNAAVLKFRAHQFNQARILFERAALDDPDRLTLRYWRALCYVALGDSPEAYRQMRMLEAVLSPPAAQAVRLRLLLELEMIQGPIRYEFERLYFLAMANLPIDALQ